MVHTRNNQHKDNTACPERKSALPTARASIRVWASADTLRTAFLNIAQAVVAGHVSSSPAQCVLALER